ncbi:MAG TPA: hypothetical protein VF131_13780 [Blastocatellia bacterium]|nr:hypothetical protein [Blastocatellia bacterium]
MKKRVTIISVERERVVEIRLQGRTGEGWCEQCRIRAHMLKPEELAAIAGFSPSQVFRLLETGRLHCIRTAEGLLFVCLNSLQQTAGLLAGDEKPNARR